MTTSLRTQPRDWIARAACRDYPAQWWYPEKSGPGTGQRAINVCRTCPVIGECHFDAEQRNEPWGIWGGKPRRGTALGSPHKNTVYEEFDPLPLASRCCVRCKQFWATTATGIVTTALCPDCIGKTPGEIV